MPKLPKNNLVILAAVAVILILVAVALAFVLNNNSTKKTDNNSESSILSRQYPLNESNQTSVIKSVVYGTISAVSADGQQITISTTDNKIYQVSLNSGGTVSQAFKTSSLSSLKVGGKVTVYSKSESPVVGKTFNVDLIEAD